MPATLSLSGALGHAHADKRIDILRQIGVCGSISQGARAVGGSYKAAWQAVGTVAHPGGGRAGGGWVVGGSYKGVGEARDTLTNLAGAPLVARAGGGAGGGGARLTAAGRELLAAADALALARGAVLARWQAAPGAGPARARRGPRPPNGNHQP